MENPTQNKHSLLFITNDELDANISRKPFLKWILKNKNINCGIIYPIENIKHKKIKYNGLDEYYFNTRGISFSNLFNLKRIINENSYNIVISRGFENIILWSITFFLVNRKPNTIFFLTGLGRLFDSRVPVFIKSIYKIILRLFQYLLKATIIVQNEDDANELKLSLNSVINGSGYNQNRIWKKKSLKKINIITASRLTKSKGIEDILKFAEYVSFSENKYLNYLILGDYSHLSKKQKNKIIELNKYPNICFKGFDKSVQKLLSQSHFAFFPSKYREGSPRFLIEAISNGLIPITTNEPGCKSFLKYGILYTSPNKTLIEVNKLINEKLYNNLSIKNYNYFKSKFSSKVVYEKYYEVIKNKLTI